MLADIERENNLTIDGHSLLDAFLIAALWTLVAGRFVNDTQSIIFTCVFEIFLCGPSEEALMERNYKNE